MPWKLIQTGGNETCKAIEINVKHGFAIDDWPFPCRFAQLTSMCHILTWRVFGHYLSNLIHELFEI